MKNVIQRTVTGFIFVIVIICSIHWNPYPFAILFLLFTFLGQWEFYKMVHSKRMSPQFIIGLISGVVLYVTLALKALLIIPDHYLLINLLMLLAIFIVELFSGSIKTVENVSFNVLGLVYIVIPFALLNFFSAPGFLTDAYNPSVLIGYFIILWSYDIFAYLGGKTFGKHKLYARISPFKTWEGTITGGIIALVAAFLVSKYICQIGFHHWGIIALIVILFGTFGDLFESMLKRNFNVKDAGTIFPGHGGILDRFDGLFFSAPAVFVYLLLII